MTVVPGPAAAWIPCSGATLNVEVTYALPPPVSVGMADAAGPITAIVPPPLARTGRVLRLFLSSTVPASATVVETAWFAGVVTVAVVEPVGGLLNSLKRNISVRIRLTMSSRVPMLTWPSCTAAWSAGP